GFAVGALVDRYGPRLMLLLTAPLAGAGFALVATVESRWQLYMYVGVVAGVGTSTFYLLAASTVPHCFQDRRGPAVALVLSGFKLGYISAGPLAARLIPSLGWRQAYALLAGGCGVISVLAALSVRFPSASEAAALRRPGSSSRDRHVVSAASHGGATLAPALADPRHP